MNLRLLILCAALSAGMTYAQTDRQRIDVYPKGSTQPIGFDAAGVSGLQMTGQTLSFGFRMDSSRPFATYATDRVDSVAFSGPIAVADDGLPQLTSMSCEYAPAGTEATIYGRNLTAPVTVTFPNGQPAQVTSLADDAVSFIVPECDQEGPIAVTSGASTVQTRWHYRDTRGMLFDFETLADGGTGLFSQGWKVRDAIEDEHSLSGCRHYITLGDGTTMMDAGGSWMDVPFRFDYWCGSWDTPQNITSAPGKALFNQADFTHSGAKALKFELSIPATNAWGAAAMQLCFQPIEQVTLSGNPITGYSTVGTANHEAFSESLRSWGRAFYTPWTPGEPFHTDGKWVTVTIPLRDFCYDCNGTITAFYPYAATDFASLTMFLLNGWNSPAGQDCTPLLRIDNIRVVPYSNPRQVFASPTVASAGDWLALTGQDLNIGVSAVQFPGNGLAQSQPSMWNGEQMLVRIPANAAGTGMQLVLIDGSTVAIDDMPTIAGGEFQQVSVSDVYIGQPGNLTGQAGDVLTVKGRRLDLIHSVRFQNGTSVAETNFTAHNESTISLTLDWTMGSGQLTLSDGDGTAPALYPTPQRIAMSEPVVTAVTPTPAKAGSVVTLAGQYLEQVARVSLPWGSDAYLNDIDMERSANQISFKLPATASDGDILLTTLSGSVVKGGQLVTVKPQVTAVSPQPVKNRQRLTLTGTDLDLVTGSIRMPGNVWTEPTAASETAISLYMPWNAQEGDLELRMANGHVTYVPFTLVKPAVTAYSQNPVPAGSQLTLSGTDLDLVGSVSFGQQEVLPEQYPTESAITVTVPIGAASGQPVLNLQNGTRMAAPQLTVGEPVICHITALPGPDEELRGGQAMTVPVANGDKLVAVTVNKLSCDFTLSADQRQLTITLPESAGRNSTLRLVSTNGEVSYTLNVIPAGRLVTVLWEGEADLASWSWNWQIGDGSAGASNPQMFADQNLQAGDVIRLYMTAYNDWWQVQFFDGHWSTQTEIGVATGLGNSNNINAGIYNLAEHDGAIEIPVTATLAQQLTTLNDWGYCWILQGEGVIITKITLEQ